MPPTTALMNAVVNYLFGKQAFSPAIPDPLYIGLSTTRVDATGLASATEPLTASGYARISYANDTGASGWTTATTGSNSNKAAATFAESTADWGTILSVFIADSGTRAAGNILWYYTLSPSVECPDNTILSFDIGHIINSVS
jgi:hypothetical protein